jgi:hypothetical protein
MFVLHCNHPIYNSKSNSCEACEHKILNVYPSAWELPSQANFCPHIMG